MIMQGKAAETRVPGWENTVSHIAEVTHENVRLRRLLAEADVEQQKLERRFHKLERESIDLANLYVAGVRLSEALEPASVLDAVQEIVVNLIGCEEHVVLTKESTQDGLVLARAMGVDPASYQHVVPGVGVIGTCFSSGVTFTLQGLVSVDALPEDTITASIPLVLGASVLGVIALFRLLPQKPRYSANDRELFKVLGLQAARAWFCAQALSPAAQD